MALIRDLTAGDEPVVDLAMHPAFDMLLSVWIAACRDNIDTYDIGREWFDHLEDTTPEHLKKAVAALGDPELWLALLPTVASMVEGSSIDEYLDGLAGSDVFELRSRLLEHRTPRTVELQELVKVAAGGDSAATDELLTHQAFVDRLEWAESLRALLVRDGLIDDIVDVLRRFHADVFAPHAEDFLPSLKRDIEAKRSLARTVSPARLIELATNGVAVGGGPDARPVLLTPSVVMRPWVVVTESPTHRVVCYPVAEEFLIEDPDAPAPWLVRVYKALGDGRRLRLLRRLGSGPASLTELTDHLEIAKSTVHHHLRTLRAAGLVRVVVNEGDDRLYSLRTDAAEEAAAVLRAYLEPGRG